ncbi:hypothetical protein [Thermogemmatispora sp.]|uniref:hypothetical protein n=1 Tax=Thermogemmatispora sp. TaxID=1968838 RepID=UPI001D9ADE55|nr:hypothetical protein [Thermogemmatispora sp.]MBX5451156.1 hypothetical protein [Thermogemmatispora sp.]
MDKVYYLDLQTLLDNLQGQSAILSTTVSVPSVRGTCQGLVFVKDGTVLESLIQGPNGALLASGARAYALLSSRDQWQVRIQPDVEQILRTMIQPALPESEPRPGPGSRSPQAALPPAGSASFSLSPVPRPLRPLDAQLLAGFSMRQRFVLRLVFTMVNGERSVEQIKAQLNLSPAVVEEALTTLRTLGVIS